MILVDTNAWVHHLRKRDARLAQLLVEQRVRTCSVVMGELVLGSGLPRTFANDLAALPRLPSPTADETHAFIKRYQGTFSSADIGWADAQIILTAAKSGARIHTSDRHVRGVCTAIRVPLA